MGLSHNDEVKLLLLKKGAYNGELSRMDTALTLIIITVITALIFDFINGFHDAANSIATIIGTGVLTPKLAVLWAAFFNFIAFLFFNLMVAKTIGQGLIDPHVINAPLILSALIGAITWNLITWYYGLPSSSSHALIGGLAGAALISYGKSALVLAGFIKVFLGILIIPFLGLIFGFGITRFFKWLSQKTALTLKQFKMGQLVSSAFLSLTHGGNDAQKTMGIIAALLYSSSLLGDTFYVPLWVVLACQLFISLGTLVGGFRIVKTLGFQITDLNPLKGCAAESSAAIFIFIATECGIPVSTTHTVTGAIAGAGLIDGVHGTHWPIMRRILTSWLLTLPASGLIAAGCYLTLF